MLSLYNLLEDKRSKIVSAMLNKIPEQVPAYRRISRPELKQSIGHLMDAYLDLLVTDDDDSLRKFFKYVARVRASQSFSQSAVMRAILCLPTVLRPILQREFREREDGGKKDFDQAIAKVEETIFDAAALFSEVYNEYLQSRVDEHNEYLNERNSRLGIDLSKLILFRA